MYISRHTKSGRHKHVDGTEGEVLVEQAQRADVGLHLVTLSGHCTCKHQREDMYISSKQKQYTC